MITKNLLEAKKEQLDYIKNSEFAIYNENYRKECNCDNLKELLVIYFLIPLAIVVDFIFLPIELLQYFLYKKFFKKGTKENE